MAGRLQGKVAMITGGNSGIGEATARLFTQEGAKVAILARREAEGHAVQEAIRAEGREITFLPCDVTDRAAVEAAVAQTVAAYGGLDVLINNAGGGAREMFPDESDETWDRVLRVNLTACFLTCRAAWPHLIKSGGGAIVNVSSLAAVSGVSEAVLERFPTASFRVLHCRKGRPRRFYPLYRQPGRAAQDPRQLRPSRPNFDATPHHPCRRACLRAPL